MGGYIGMINLFNYYKIRLLIPWIFAIFLYFFLFNINYEKDIFSIIKNLIENFLLPYFHLWFICGFLSYVAFVWYLKAHIKVTNKNLLISSTLISIVLYFLSKEIPFFPSKDNELMTNILSSFLYTFRDYFLLFFVFGYLLRELKIEIKPYYIFGLLVLFVANILFFYFGEIYVIINGLFWYGFNLLLIYVVVGTMQKNSYFKVSIIEYIGKQSLGFYLWHMIPILIAESIFRDDCSFYLSSFFLVLVFFIAYRALDKIDFISKYLFGNFINEKIKNI